MPTFFVVLAVLAVLGTILLRSGAKQREQRRVRAAKLAKCRSSSRQRRQLQQRRQIADRREEFRFGDVSDRRLQRDRRADQRAWDHAA